MPLPRAGSLALQGQSSSTSLGPRSKKAMIVKLSDEILDALLVRRLDQPTAPALDVIFGDNAGIHIGSTFFAAHVFKEDTAHELFIRSDKPSAPLRHYAMVEGKLTVTRELDSRTENRVRSRGEELDRISKDRKIQVLDTPPSVNSKTASKPSKKKSNLSKQVTVKSDASMRPTAVVELHPANKPLSPPSKDDLLRKRLIHYLALSPACTRDVIQNVGGQEHATVQNALSELLTSVANEDPPPRRNTAKPLPRLWRLKSEAWLEVRPFEYPKLTDPERKNMALQARRVLTTLKIPETDPRWAHVQSRNNTTNTSNGVPAVKKEKMAPSLLSSGASKPRRLSREVETSSLKTPPVQRNTSSSAKTGPERSRDLSPLPSPQPSASKSRSSITKTSLTTPTSRLGDASPNGNSTNLPRKPHTSTETGKNGTALPGVKDLVKRKRPSSTEEEEVLTRAGEPKRKKPTHENGVRSSVDYARKQSTSHELHGHRDVHVKTSSRDEIANMPSTSSSQVRGHRPPPSYDEKRRSVTESNGPTSKRRKSPIYTSSSDDKDEFDTPTRGAQGSAYPSIQSNVPARDRAKRYVRPNVSLGGPLPKDRSSLRRTYGSIYPVYLTLFQRCMEQRAAIERALGDGVPPEEGEVDEELETDMDLDVMNTSDLEQLTADCVRIERELTRIKDALGESGTHPKSKEPKR